jgi:protein-S-isoprenylcysteine O-methyltransferase Ste14
MNPRPYSAKVLALCGLILIRMGLYLILLRSALLPEDIRYIGTCLCTSGWREEREVRETFGEEYARYAAATPAFFPRLGSVRPKRA